MKLTIVEGPDGSGKTTYINKMRHNLDDPENIVVMRYPDNREDVPIRDLLFNSSMTEHRMGSAFLFLADFLHGFEKDVLPRIGEPGIHFVFDRHIPSMLIYQGIPLHAFNMLINSMFDLSKFVWFMRKAEYIYLKPKDLPTHIARLQSKYKTGDTNAYDPKEDDHGGIVENLFKYRDFFENGMTRLGILGSYNLKTIEV